jgi:hypothetical protein
VQRYVFFGNHKQITQKKIKNFFLTYQKGTLSVKKTGVISLFHPVFHLIKPAKHKAPDGSKCKKDKAVKTGFIQKHPQYKRKTCGQYHRIEKKRMSKKGGNPSSGAGNRPPFFVFYKKIISKSLFF